MSQVRSHLQSYPCPANLTFNWNFGFLAGISFVTQICTGLLLATRYSSDLNSAYQSVLHITRECHGGWFFRYLHATGASIIFVCLFIHIARALCFCSYKYLSLTWITGLIIYIVTIAISFLGYVLPWGQMSFWGATVICNLLSGIPNLVEWLLGGFYVDSPTLKRFFVLHFILPFIVMLCVVLHIFYLHLHSSTNPLGVNTALKVPFYPYLLASDIKGITFLGLCYIGQTTIGFIELSHPDNSIPVNRFVTPLHITPEWYFLAYYAILKVVPSRLSGLLVFMGSILQLFFLSEVRGRGVIIRQNNRYFSRKGLCPYIFYLLSFLFLVIIGAALPTDVYIRYGRYAVVIYILSAYRMIRL